MNGDAEVKREEIGRGAVMISEARQGREIVAIHLFLKMGCLYESEDRAGISNLMQNLVLKGTESMDCEALDERLDAMGSRLFSSTGKETGSLSLLCTRAKLQEALEVMRDVITNPAMTEDEFEKERELALDEIRQREDELLTHTLDLFQEAFYGRHPMHKTVQGTEESLRRMTLDDVREFHDCIYVPGNMVFSCSGDFDQEIVRDTIAEVVERLSSRGEGGEGGRERAHSVGVTGQDTGGRIVEEIRQDHREKCEERDSAAAWVVVGYPAPSLGEEGSHEMQVINAILGGSMDSRLFTRLREKRGLAYQVSSIYRAYSGPSFLAGYIGTNPERYEEALTGLITEIEEIAREEVEEDELERAKEYLKGVFLIGGETMAARAARRGKYEIMGLGFDYEARYLKGIESVTAERMNCIAREHLRCHSMGAVFPRGQLGKRKR
jgi:predicted Zn-dependent peptidase